MTYFRLLTQRCNIIRRTQTTDGNNKPVVTDLTVKGDVRCKLDSVRVRSQDVSEPGSIKSIFRAIIYLDGIEEVIKERDKIVLEGIRYEIVNINPVSNLQKLNHYEIEVLKEVDV